MPNTPFNFPGFSQNSPITADGSLASKTAIDWWNQMLAQITSQFDTQTTQIEALQNTEAQLQSTIQSLQANVQSTAQAQATADAAGGGSGGQSGTLTANVATFGSAWTNGPRVDLTSVVAGTLTIQGSGPYRTPTTTISPTGETFVGNWRIQEIISGVETTIFTGTYTAIAREADSSVTYTLYNNTDTQFVSIPRTSTGAVSYRLDINSNGFMTTHVSCTLYVRRA